MEYREIENYLDKTVDSYYATVKAMAKTYKETKDFINELKSTARNSLQRCIASELLIRLEKENKKTEPYLTQ